MATSWKFSWPRACGWRTPAARCGPDDLKRVTVDTTVQPKNITFPTDAKLLHAAINGIVRLAKKHGVQLRQSYLRIAKRAAMMAGRYAHAKQFKRHHRQLRLLRTRLGRIIRDVRRKIAGRAEIEAAFEWPLARANQIRSQQQRQRGWKLYSFHAPEVECIGKGKASAPYEFGVKASIVTTNARAPGGQFVLHAKALPGNPYDGHTLGAVIDDTQKLTGCEIERVYVDKGYRGHNAPNPRRVFISGQKRGVFGVIKRDATPVRHRTGDRPLEPAEASAAATSKAAKATPPTPCSPRPDICLVSALQFHEITLQNTRSVWIAIGSKDRKPAIDYPPIRVMRFGAAGLSLGRRDASH